MELKVLFTNTSSLISRILVFFLGALFVIACSYADAILIAANSQKWLLYYYLSDPLLTMCIFYFSQKYLSRATEKQSFKFVLGTTPFLLMVYFATLQFPIASFILSLMLPVFTKLIFTIGWNAIATAFDLGTFKKHVFSFSIWGIVGSILAAFIIPVVIHFSNSNVVFYMTLLDIIICATCILNLVPFPEPAVSKKQEIMMNVRLYKQPYFRFLFCFTALTLAVRALAEYSFKNALMGHYSQDTLISFISLFAGIITGLGFLVQLFLAKSMLKWLGLIGILLILPLACLEMGIGLAIWPIFTFFIIFNGVNRLFNDFIVVPCREIMLNPYPSLLRKKANLLINGLADPLGRLLGAGCLFFAHYFGINMLGAIVALLALPWIYSTIRSCKGYQDLLFTSIKENRYQPGVLNVAPGLAVFMRAELLNALRSSSIDSIKTGLSFFEQKMFLEQLNDAEIRQAISQKLIHSEPTVRLVAAQALKSLNASDSISKLKAQLHLESNSDAGWAMVDSLITLEPECENTIDFLQDSRPFIQAYANIILAHSQENSAQRLSEQSMLNLLNGDDEQKKLLAQIINYLPSSLVNENTIKTLLQDASDEVSITMLQSLSKHKNAHFIPILYDFLNLHERAFYAEQALADRSTDVTDFLLNQSYSAMTGKPLRAFVRLLTQSGDPRVFVLLIELSKGPSLILRSFIAMRIGYYAHLYSTKSTHSAAISGLLKWLKDEIVQLMQLKTDSDVGLEREIRIQLRMNRKAFLSWFGLLIDYDRIRSIEGYITSPEKYNNVDVAKAYEFLDSLCPAHLRDVIAVICQDYVQEKPIQEGLGMNKYLVLLATHPYTPKENRPMNTIDKISFLRQVTLFEDIPLEFLQVIADIAQQKDMSQNEVLFKRGEESGGIYFIVSGAVAIKLDEHTLSQLQTKDYFGELGTLDSSSRTTDAIATSNGMLLYIEKEEFLRLLDDVPEVMRSIIAQVITYLRRNLSLLQAHKKPH